MGGLTLNLNPQHNSIIRPTDKTCFVFMLAVVKYFDKSNIWCDEWPEINRCLSWHTDTQSVLQNIVTTVYIKGSMIIAVSNIV